MITAQAFDGSQHQFPDGTAPAVIDQALLQYTQTARAAPAKTDKSNWWETDAHAPAPAWWHQDAIANKSAIPPPPPGFTIDSQIPPPPPGFTLDAPAHSDNTEVPNLPVRISHGVNRGVQAVKQLYLMATDPAAAKDYTAELNDQEARYQAGMAKGAKEEASNPSFLQKAGAAADLVSGAPISSSLGIGYSGPDVPSIAGQGMLLAPTMFLPGGVALPARIGWGALQGAIAGADQPSQAGTWWDKTKQGAEGAGVGAVLPAGTDAVAALASALKNRIAGAPAGVIPTDIASRQAAFDALNMQPTKAQLTRSPQDWYAEQELGKAEGPAKDLFTTRGTEQNAQLASALAKMQQTPGTTSYQACEAARETVQDWASGKQDVVSNLYTQARNAAGANAEVPMQPIADQVGKVAEEYGPENIGPAVTARLQQYGLLGGTQTRSLTVADAEGLRKFLGNNTNWSNPAQAKSIAMLQNSVDEAVGNVSTSGSAAQAFQTARAAARDRFAELEPSITSGLFKADEVSVNWIPTKVMGGKPREVQALMATLNKQDPATASMVHDAVIDELQKASTQGNTAFSPVKFGAALDKLGPDRAAAIFPPDELAQLNNIRTAGTAMIAPELTGINRSNTGSVLLNALRNSKSMESIGVGAGEFIGHSLGGWPEAAAGTAIGYGAGKLAKAIAQRQQEGAMASMLSPDIQKIVDTGASDAQRKALAAALARINRPLIPPFASQAAQ